MSLFEFFWNWQQENDLDSLRKQTLRHSHTASQNSGTLKRLASENEELKTCMEALSGLLVERGVISEDELKAAITARREKIAADKSEAMRRRGRGPNQHIDLARPDTAKHGSNGESAAPRETDRG